MALGLAFFDTRAWPVTTLLLILNFTIIGLQARKSLASRQRLLQLGPWLPRLRRLRRVLESGQFEGEPLRRSREALREFATPGERLGRHVRRLGLHSLGPLYELINLLTLWELQILPLAERHLERHLEGLHRSLESLGEVEALVCLAMPLLEQEDFAMPRVLELEAPHLEAEEVAHPLLDTEGLVRNDVEIGGEKRLWIITGSNMAGKSTFLKAVGTNLALAQAGGPVCASRLEWTPLELLSDINIRDSLDDGKSYFQVEVERVLRMVEAARRGPHVLAILDELFRGTNSAERLAISRSILLELRDRGILALVATHDGALTRLVTEREEEGMVNYHFQEQVESDTMAFDYRLRPGPARTRNALRVLEISGYPESITRAAREDIESPEG